MVCTWQDSSLWCVSSWNDHGQKKFVSDETRLMRSEFFPGLGWMTRRDVWDSIKAEWCAACHPPSLYPIPYTLYIPYG